MENKEILYRLECLKAILAMEHIKTTDYARETVDIVLKFFEQVESGELVEVVHCKDCKSWLRVSECRSDGYCKCLEEYHDAGMARIEENHTCGYGEEKGGDEK
jgi:hypothetical protein